MCCKVLYYSVVCKEGQALYDLKCKKGWGGNYKRIANGGGDLVEGSCTSFINACLRKTREGQTSDQPGVAGRDVI